ncbi:aspartate 1-decarboxylase [Boudabousia tangfeifanii]|uniref:Aspartate 1-decarboxylase n=1 Tax=Boudabousia tangfeifanii TaxID=1912795 RepID=A0A1D9ML57_9ACTO|nr:aspartate 1-decarboxylase [Boudabousia tangfeifanii]AOZ73032.1 aspartate 1-decarboxylase [Boudabousia tangfeifanii]
MTPALNFQREVFCGKIHRATVTEADLDYVGSVTIDRNLLEAANIAVGQKVDIVDVTNGARLSTYTIAGEPGKGEIKINGAAAHLINPGDIVIIIAYAYVWDQDLADFTPHVVLVDKQNQIISQSAQPGQVDPVGATQTGGASESAPLRSSGIPRPQ